MDRLLCQVLVAASPPRSSFGGNQAIPLSQCHYGYGGSRFQRDKTAHSGPSSYLRDAAARLIEPAIRCMRKILSCLNCLNSDGAVVGRGSFKIYKRCKFLIRHCGRERKSYIVRQGFDVRNDAGASVHGRVKAHKIGKRRVIIS